MKTELRHGLVFVFVCVCVFFLFICFVSIPPGKVLWVGQFSAVYAHEGYNLFKFVGEFLLAGLVVLIKGSKDLCETGKGERC